MARNDIPRSYDPLIQLLEDATDGAHTHGVAVGLLQNNETTLRTVLVGLIGAPMGPGGIPPAEPGLKLRREMAKAAKVAATGAFVSVKGSGRALARACVNILKPRLGSEWTNDWQRAGFTANSIAIPANPMALLRQMRAYFQANPAHEKLDVAPGIHATAAACETAAEAISTASTASNNSRTAAGTAKSNYEAGVKAARSRLSGLRDELTQLIAPDDDRWYAFGFEKPGNPESPEAPENVTGTPGAGGMLLVGFDGARRAKNYRVRILDAATNALLAQRLTRDREVTFQGLPTATPLRIEVTAVNATGETGPVTLLITLP